MPQCKELFEDCRLSVIETHEAGKGNKCIRPGCTSNHGATNGEHSELLLLFLGPSVMLRSLQEHNEKS